MVHHQFLPDKDSGKFKLDYCWNILKMNFWFKVVHTKIICTKKKQKMGRNHAKSWKFLLKYFLKWKCNVWSLLKKVFGRIYCEILEIFLEHFFTPLHFLKHRSFVEYLDQFRRGKKLSHPILLHILFDMGTKKGLVQ